MDFCWALEDDDIENSVFYGNMPYGSPGEESLKYGMQTVMPSKEQLEHLHCTMYAQRRCLDSDPPGIVDVVLDSGLDVASCSDCIHPKRESVATELDVTSSDKFSKQEPQSLVLVAVAPGLWALHDGSYEYDYRKGEWSKTQPATAEIHPLAVNCRDRKPIHKTQIERKTGTRKQRDVFRGIHKIQPKKIGNAFKKSPKSAKGLTMCLRTLLRQLLAGSGWIVEAGIRKNEALSLIRLLLGEDLNDKIQLDLPISDAPHLTDEWREMHYTSVLADIISLYTGNKIMSGEVERCFILYTGSYSLSPRFLAILGEKQWPPYLPKEEELCRLGCYRPGDKKWTKEEAQKFRFESSGLRI